MALSRKRRKELKRLKNQAEHLWHDQQELLAHASKVAKSAGRQAGHFAREDVAPRVRHTIDGRVKPAISDGVHTVRSAASTTRDKLGDVIPGFSSAVGTALAAIEVAKNEQVKDAIARVSKITNDVGVKVGVVKPKPGPGKYILIGLAVVAVGAAAYAAWQTLRADDDLWIEDEPELVPVDAP